MRTFVRGFVSVCMRVCVPTYVRMFVWLRLCVCVRVTVYLYVCPCECVFACQCVSVRVFFSCGSVCTFVRVCVRLCV